MEKYQITKPVGIITCQVTPGSEEEIIQKLRSDLPNRSGFCDVELFFDSFSDFNLIGFVDNINDKDTRKKIDSFSCNSTTLKDIQLITCFPLISSTEPSLVFNKSDTKNALTMTLIKASGDLCSDQAKIGIEYELSYAETLSKSLKSLPGSDHFDFVILGTLGIPNIILIQRGDNLSTLLENLTRVNGNEQHNEALFFHTIPCVRRALNDSKRQLAKVNGTVYWRIGISCFDFPLPTFISLLINDQSMFLKYFELTSEAKELNPFKLIDEFITIDYAYGKRDIVIRPKKTPKHLITGESSTQDINFILLVLDSIAAIGKKGNLHNAIETKTELFIDYQEDSVKIPFNDLVPALGGDRIKPDLNREFKDWYEKAQILCNKEIKYNHPQFVYGRRVIDLIERFQLTYNMPQMWEIVYDMKDYLATVIIDLVASISSELPTYPENDLHQRILFWYANLEADINLFNFALDKRLAGVDLGIGSRVVSNISGLGNFRTLLAAKAISHCLFRLANSFWNGFTVFSYYSTTSFHQSGIINMPEYSLDDLVAWNQIGHETGHSYTIQHNLMETTPFITDLSLSLQKQPGFGSKAACDNFIEELIADIFEYLFCYGGNFDLYRDTTWRNLDHDLLNSVSSDTISRHLLRTICVLFIHFENQTLLEPGNSVDNKLGKEKGYSLIYQNPTLEEGVRDHILGREINFCDCVAKNIINPLIRKDKFVHIGNEISRCDIESLESSYKIIDNFRGNLLSLFSVPLKNNRSKNYKPIKWKVKFKDIRVDTKKHIIYKSNKSNPFDYDSRYWRVSVRNIVFDLKKHRFYRINKGKPLDFEYGNWKEKIEDIKEILVNHEVYRITQENPFDVFCLLIATQELKENYTDIDLAMNLSIILSLWDYYRREFKDMISKINKEKLQY